MTVTKLIAALRELEPEHGSKQVQQVGDLYHYDVVEVYEFSGQVWLSD